MGVSNNFRYLNFFFASSLVQTERVVFISLNFSSLKAKLLV